MPLWQTVRPEAEFHTQTVEYPRVHQIPATRLVEDTVRLGEAAHHAIAVEVRVIFETTSLENVVFPRAKTS